MTDTGAASAHHYRVRRFVSHALVERKLHGYVRYRPKEEPVDEAQDPAHQCCDQPARLAVSPYDAQLENDLAECSSKEPFVHAEIERTNQYPGNPIKPVW